MEEKAHKNIIMKKLAPRIKIVKKLKNVLYNYQKWHTTMFFVIFRTQKSTWSLDAVYFTRMLHTYLLYIITYLSFYVGTTCQFQLRTVNGLRCVNLFTLISVYSVYEERIKPVVLSRCRLGPCWKCQCGLCLEMFT